LAPRIADISRIGYNRMVWARHYHGVSRRPNKPRLQPLCGALIASIGNLLLMLDRTALILLDGKSCRHSLNALVGALETDRKLDALELRLPSSEAQLASHVAEVLLAGKRPIVGLSFTTPQLWNVRDLMYRLKARWTKDSDPSKVIWIAGGPHPTADPEGTLRIGFDVAVCGEGEATLLDLLRAIGTGGDGVGVPGTSVRGRSGEIHAGGCRKLIDLDAFPPFPLWRRRIVGPIEITRGCPFACAYCQTSYLQGPKPRHRSIETIARYAGVIRQRGLRDVRVVTPNAFSYGSPDGKTLNFAAVKSLLQELRQTLGPDGRLYFGSFPSEVRPEHVNPDTVELVIRYANNDNLVIGAQSGSERILRLCRRGHTVAEVFSAVSCTLAAGLKPQVDFIFGLPGETLEDIKRTIEVIQELAAMGALIPAPTFMPLPQTGFAGPPPGRIHGRLRLVIIALIRNGSLHGLWHKQERVAQRIARYLESGEL